MNLDPLHGFSYSLSSVPCPPLQPSAAPLQPLSNTPKLQRYSFPCKYHFYRNAGPVRLQTDMPVQMSTGERGRVTAVWVFLKIKHQIKKV